MTDKPTSDTREDLGARSARTLKARRRHERVFHACGLGAALLAISALVWLLAGLVATGHTAIYQHHMTLDVTLDAARLDPDGTNNADLIRTQDFTPLIKQALARRFPEAMHAADRRELGQLVSLPGASDIARRYTYETPAELGKTVTLSVPVSDEVDQFLKGRIKRKTPEARRKLSDQQLAWIDQMVADGDIKARFNWAFFTGSDSPNAELAGIGSAAIGSLMAVLVAFFIAVPIGVGAALYLEEFAPRNRLTDIVDININNLAAIPSIIFGLLGLALFLNFAGLPRSAPLVGGLVLALMTLPTIIIATRSALGSVPQSIMDSALSLGASHTQAVFHHKVPMAMPGILTGTILGMAQALGETAPLLLIGMVAFVTSAPSSVMDASSALPVQIFLWSENAEPAWAERTAAAVLVLLTLMTLLNTLAVLLRSRLERRW